LIIIKYIDSCCLTKLHLRVNVDNKIVSSIYSKREAIGIILVYKYTSYHKLMLDVPIVTFNITWKV